MSYNLGYYTNTSNPGGTTPLRSFPGSEGYAAGPTGGGQSLGPSRGAYQPYSTTAQPIRRLGGLGSVAGAFGAAPRVFTPPHLGIDWQNQQTQAGNVASQLKAATATKMASERAGQGGALAGGQVAELGQMAQANAGQQAMQNKLGVQSFRDQYNAGNQVATFGPQATEDTGAMSANAEAQRARQDYLLGLQRLYAPGTPGGPVASAFGAIG